MGELGSLLTRAREARGLTIEDAERDTRISRRYLQALEDERFEVIPAPVYARGFLRSYSQYLGLDPQDALALFPRDEEPSPYHAGGTQSASQQRSVSPSRQPATVGAARPTWRRPPQQAASARPAAPPRPGRGEPGWEPTIGVDIGVPARRLRTDPAAQARSMTVLIVAVAAIAAVVLVAFGISRFAGDNGGPGSPFGQRTATVTATAAGGAAEETPTSAGAGDITPGIMPNVVGLTEAAAREALIAAGFPATAISRTTGPNAATAGTVFAQQPIPGAEVVVGDQAIIAVSEGP